MDDEDLSSSANHPKILNVSHDNMFVARFSNYLENVAPGSADYVILATDGVKHPPAGGLTTSFPDFVEAREHVLSIVEDYDFLIIHYMFPGWAELVPEVKGKVRTIWSGYGGDYYGDDWSSDVGLLSPLTEALHETLVPRLNIFGRTRRFLTHGPVGKPKRRAARSIDYFSAPVSADLDIFKKRYRGFRGKYVQLSYATVEESAPIHGVVLGDDVLVGNSASYTNNHLDVFQQLKSAKELGRKVFVPLSYGEPEAYKQAVLSAGLKIFGSDFEPILDFLPLEDYSRLVTRCSFAIMGHRRQQGLGNIVTALLAGQTVVLDSHNPLYRELRGQGAGVASLQELDSRGLNRLQLSPDTVEENREIARRLWGEREVLERMNRFFFHGQS